MQHMPAKHSIRHRIMHCISTTRVFALFLLFVLFFALVSPVAADDAYEDFEDFEDFPATEEEFRAVTGWGDAPLPADIAEYYDAVRAAAAAHTAAGVGTGAPYCGSITNLIVKPYIDFSLPEDISYYMRGSDDYWYAVPDCTDETVDAWWDWLHTDVPESERLQIIADAKIPSKYYDQTQGMMPEPYRLKFGQSAYIWWHATSNKPGATYGEPGYNIQQRTFDRYHPAIEHEYAQTRENEARAAHSWAPWGHDDTQWDLDVYPADPYAYATMQAAAREMGHYDGYTLAWYLGVSGYHAYIHNPREFEDIEFPSGEDRLNGAYKAIYSWEFGQAMEQGFRDGCAGKSLKYQAEEVRLQKFKVGCELAQGSIALADLAFQIVKMIVLHH